MLPNNALFMQICMHMSRVCMITVTATCPMGYLIKPVFALFIYPILPCIQKHTFTHVYMFFSLLSLGKKEVEVKKIITVFAYLAQNANDQQPQKPLAFDNNTTLYLLTH